MSKPDLRINMQNALPTIHQPRRLHPSEVGLTGVIRSLTAVAVVLAVVVAAASCSQQAEERLRAEIAAGRPKPTAEVVYYGHKKPTLAQIATLAEQYRAKP